MQANWHVAGLVVQAQPHNILAVGAAINELPGSEVAASDAEHGKLVVVMEAARSDVLLNQIESARNIAGVLAVSLVYHQQDEQGEETP
ncbi:MULTISPECIES: chaperone NapD [Buttiauxella]|jgi:nitrate reductase NapD|uniref:Chaperone NapD n=1 Tax=Buttiauxella ferragutiae ATCC 51602 TaxID=1354252 RepID=A0ABX2W900_9ENTR|nr:MULTISPECIES: chaperone NapD [Buttiauxella]AYN29385.1 chaperone NapD [Buttiauxella sp. 3AFRM03]MCE0825495.1 chaperone NapD [Buttiauxella ferragutiae]OAT27997.1 NapD family periplasmic nitrate reductase component [Buttiauxella ferragutiae ATCC 51602]TDN55469.1 periplasmic nitrate reductase chaperone NapD [Buttiauxella sp. JUb87]UNK62520.1 chaperone NapD [Buttiauxella ferragutiae]